MQQVHGHREEAALAPLHFVLMRTVTESCGAAPGETVDELLVKLPGGEERLAIRDLHDGCIHVHVPGEIQVHAAPADLRPRLDFLRGGVQDGVALDHGDFARLGPVAVEIAFDASAAADVLGAVDHAGFLFLRRLALLGANGRARERKGQGLHQSPPRQVAGEQVVEQATHDLFPFLDILRGTPAFCSSVIYMSRMVGSSSAYSIRLPPRRVLVLPSRWVRPPPPSERMNHFPSPPQVAARYRAGSPPVLKCWWNQPSGGTNRRPSAQSTRTLVGASEYNIAPFHISVNPWPFSITTCDPGPLRCAFL